MDGLQKVAALVVIFFTCWYPFLLRYIQLWQRRRNPVDGRQRPTTLKMEEYFTRGHSDDDQTFPQFVQLGEDLMRHVLSFVAEAPFEDLKGKGVHNFVSSLTHALPLVSKQFQRMVLHNEQLWKAALYRQLTKEPMLWYGGLRSLLPAAADQDDISEEEKEEQEQEEENKDYTKQKATQLLNKFDGTTTTYAQLYQTVLNTRIRFKGPIFCMNQSLRLGRPYGLHFFEPRYRLLIAEVMQPFSEEARQGEPIEVEEPGQTPPIFIHAHTYPLRQGSPAVLVQVIRCRIYPGDGRADVFLLPICYVRMEFMWERPASGHLYCGQCIRVGLEESQELDRASGEPHVFGY